MNKLLLAAILLVPQIANAQTDLGRVIPAGRAVRVLAIGDFGSGNSHQTAVAEAIARRHQQAPFDLGLTLGDNFYRCGVHSTKDETWKRRFEDLYSPLGIKIYASLGNHDYGHPLVACPAHSASPDAEIAYTAQSSAWRMPARYYTFAAGPVRFVVLDTEGWSEKQFEWLQQVLAASQTEEGVRWRVVYGHHPIQTSGAHAGERRIVSLRELLSPVFKEHHVDLYIAGHDHDMEHLRKDGVDYVVCGTGGAELRKPGPTQPDSIFHATTYGFAEFTIDERRMAFKFYDVDLHSLEDPEPVLRK